MPNGCGHPDCFSCPYEDCILDYSQIQPHKGRSPEGTARHKAREQALYNERLMAGRCVRCGGSREDAHYKMCLSCRRKEAGWKRDQNHRSGKQKPRELLDGIWLCKQCGKEPPLYGHQLCQRCYERCCQALGKVPTHNGRHIDNYLARLNDQYWSDRKK